MIRKTLIATSIIGLALILALWAVSYRLEVAWSGNSTDGRTAHLQLARGSLNWITSTIFTEMKPDAESWTVRAARQRTVSWWPRWHSSQPTKQPGSQAAHPDKGLAPAVAQWLHWGRLLERGG